MIVGMAILIHFTSLISAAKEKKKMKRTKKKNYSQSSFQ